MLGEGGRGVKTPATCSHHPLIRTRAESYPPAHPAEQAVPKDVCAKEKIDVLRWAQDSRSHRNCTFDDIPGFPVMKLDGNVLHQPVDGFSAAARRMNPHRASGLQLQGANQGDFQDRNRSASINERRRRLRRRHWQRGCMQYIGALPSYTYVNAEETLTIGA